MSFGNESYSKYLIVAIAFRALHQIEYESLFRLAFHSDQLTALISTADRHSFSMCTSLVKMGMKCLSGTLVNCGDRAFRGCCTFVIS